MSEKHRFKQNRDFKQRLTSEAKVDNEENEEEDDIRSFRFHSLERRQFDDKNRKTVSRRRTRNSDEAPHGKSERKPYGKNERRAFDEERKNKRGDFRHGDSRRGGAKNRREMFSDED